MTNSNLTGTMIEQKQRRLIASASPPATGKEVNNVVIKPPLRWFVVARVPDWYPRFVIFRTEVL